MENLCFFCENKNIETELIKGPDVRGIEFLHFHISVVCLLSLTRVRLCRISIRHIPDTCAQDKTPGYTENSESIPRTPCFIGRATKKNSGRRHVLVLLG